MKILLPPSETKRSGGGAASLDLSTFALPGLKGLRERASEALIALSADAEEARRILKLSERQSDHVDDNARLRRAPTMPAIDRYTGVLYDALDAGSLPAASRRWVGQHVWIQTAPWGVIGALDEIPNYRLAAGTSLPGIPPLRRYWADANSAAIAAESPDFVLDLRSEAYVALGPVPASVPSVYVRVVTEQGAALNHFNKKAKGLLLRALAQARASARSQREIQQWAKEHGIALHTGAEPGEMILVTDAIAPPTRRP